jgi:hypothetical protein
MNKEAIQQAEAEILRILYDYTIRIQTLKGLELACVNEANFEDVARRIAGAEWMRAQGCAPVGELKAQTKFFQVGHQGDEVGEFFGSIHKEYAGTPHIDVQQYENSETRLSILVVDNRAKAFVVEYRTTFNDLEFIKAKVETAAPVGEAPQTDADILKSNQPCSDEDFNKHREMVDKLLGGEKYVPEASTSDEAAVSTIRSSSGNSVEQIAQWVIDNRYPKSEGEKLTDAEMYCTLIEKIAGCAPVGVAPQSKMLQDFANWLRPKHPDTNTIDVQTYLSTHIGSEATDIEALKEERDRYMNMVIHLKGLQPNKMGMGKLRNLLNAFDSEQISMSKFLEEINIHFLGGEKYVPEASNTDEAAVSTIRSSSGNAVEQVPRTGRIHYGGHRQHTVHYVLADDTRELIKVSEASRKIAGDRLVEKQRQMKKDGYDGPFGLPHHCFSFNEAVAFTVDEAGNAVIIF